ncbi:MAG: tRNA pseudouridine(38-40) synthase TruA [Deltaproteobacteria bacterium]
MRNIKITIEYDGSAYCGWQRQSRGISIQQTIEEALCKITQEDIKIVASGRTDAGVHAVAQVANFRCNTTLNVKNLFGGLNSSLPNDIAVTTVQEVDLSFHSRRDTKSKIYLYQITNTKHRHALFRAYSWQIFGELNVKAMQTATEFLLGEHDFRSFCSTRTDVQDFVRNVMALDIEQDEEQKMISITVEANGFLRHMVRTIVGTLAKVGRGKIEPEEIVKILIAKDRTVAGNTAPPHGLFLKEVKY